MPCLPCCLIVILSEELFFLLCLVAYEISFKHLCQQRLMGISHMLCAHYSTLGTMISGLRWILQDSLLLWRSTTEAAGSEELHPHLVLLLYYS